MIQSTAANNVVCASCVYGSCCQTFSKTYRKYGVRDRAGDITDDPWKNDKHQLLTAVSTWRDEMMVWKSSRSS